MQHIMSFFAQSYNSNPYYYEYSTPGDASYDAAVVAGVFLTFLVFSFVIIAGLYVLTSFMLSRIFKKAGEQPWKAWVPVYNNWILLGLGGQKGFWAILMLIPVVNIVAMVFMFIAMYHIGLRLGKDGAFVLFAIFLPLVWLIWLAVDNSTWKREPKKS